MIYSIVRIRLVSLVIVATIAALATGCGDDEDDQNNGDPPPDDDPRTVLSDGEHFAVSWDGPDSPLPFQELFELSVDIMEAESRDLVGNADAEFRLRVADTTEGMPTQLTVDTAGDGTFTLQGLFFHVPRTWELRVDIDDGELTDRASFEFEAVGLYEGELPDDPTGRFSERDLRHIFQMSPAPPPPPDPTNAVADDDDAAHLGQFLFFDERFSEDGTVACASCHVPDHGFSDPETLSQGMGETGRRSMPALNATYHRWYFWDGRTDSQWSQALGPLESEVEHGITRTRLAHLIYEDDELKDAFESVFSALPELSDSSRFPDDARPVVDDPEHEHHQAWMSMSSDDQHAINEIFANFGKAVAAYQRRLIRNEAPFDDFVAALRDGDEEGLEVLSEQAIEGLELFVGDAECVDCHGGHQFSNFEFHNLGLEPRSWMPDDPDAGRSEGLHTVIDSDFSAHGPHSDAPDGEMAQLLSFLPEPDFHTDGRFKTPGLRNIAERAPYMHGGHVGNLNEVVEFYSDLQEDPVIGIRDPLLQQVNLSNSEVEAVVAFMESLTGAPLPDELIEAPDSPAP